MIPIEGLDKGGDVGGPFGDDGRVAARAAGLVTEFPAKNCRGRLVPVDDESDVVLVRGLSGGIGVEVVVGPTVCVNVGVDTTQSVPIVEQCEGKLDALLLGSSDGVVKASDAG